MTGFGIPNVGKAAAKTILKHFGSIEALMQADMESLQQVADVGEVTALCIRNYFQDENNCKDHRTSERSRCQYGNGRVRK